jgi:hypothetical protein
MENCGFIVPLFYPTGGPFLRRDFKAPDRPDDEKCGGDSLTGDQMATGHSKCSGKVHAVQAAATISSKLSWRKLYEGIYKKYANIILPAQFVERL